MHSEHLGLWQRGFRTAKSQQSYWKVGEYENAKPKFVCPEKLLYQRDSELPFKVSQACCSELKKKPAKKFAKENNKTIKMTGMRNAEGGQRANMNCVYFTDNSISAFHPLMVVSNEFVTWMCSEYNIELPEVYYPPYNFKRTGCKCCPYDLELQKDLDTLRKYFPNEAKQCEIIWEPVYKEYRRIGYRLK